MKKTNKILTRALVILLALVLITSSVVSSTFAKYVVRKEAKTTVGLEAFGLTVKLEGNGVNDGDTYAEQKGDSVTYQIKNVTLKPGDLTFKDAVTASVSGNPNVPVEVKIDVSVSYGGKQFKITDSAFGTTMNDKTYVPIIFYVNDKPVTSAYNSMDAEATTAAIKGGLEEHSDFTDGVYKITKDTNGNFSELPESVTFGFEWPLNAGKDANETLLFDQIGTYLANHSNKSTVTITYTISVEQTT